MRVGTEHNMRWRKRRGRSSRK